MKLLSELRSIIQKNEWSLLWDILVSSELHGDEFQGLSKYQQQIRFPEKHPTHTLRSNVPENSPWKVIFKQLVLPKLDLKSQLAFSQGCKLYFSFSTDLYEWKNEFPANFKACFGQNVPYNSSQQLQLLRAIAYPESLQILGSLFAGIAKNYSPSQFQQIGNAQELSHGIPTQRQADAALSIEVLTPLTLVIQLDNLPIFLFFLHLLPTFTQLQLHEVLTTCSQHNSLKILQFFCWAFPQAQDFRFDPYIAVACESRQLSVMRILAPRALPITLTICLASVEHIPEADHIASWLKAQGVNISECRAYLERKNDGYSQLITQIVHTDTGMNLYLLLKRWNKINKSSVFFNIINRWHKQEKLPLDVLAFLLSVEKQIQTYKYPTKSFNQFIREIAIHDDLRYFLFILLSKWRVNLLPSSRNKLITAVCAAKHEVNFRVLSDYGVDINLCFASKNHVLTSPLSRAVFSYQRSKSFFDFLVGSGAVFSLIAACQAIVGGQLAGLQALLKLSDVMIPNDTLEYHPLFVAAQFGRLDCFDFLISQGITLAVFSSAQLWDFLLQGPIAGLLQLRHTHHHAEWFKPLFKMRANLLTKMLGAEVGNKYGFPSANIFEFPRFLHEKAEAYLKIISMILPYVHALIVDDPTILLIAVSTGNITLVLMILACSPAINACNQKGESCLYLAIKQKNADMVLMLLEHGAAIGMSNRYTCPVQAASEHFNILAMILNSPQYAKENFPNFPNYKLCEACLPFLTVASKNLINPLLALKLYETFHLHPDMIPLQQIKQKIDTITLDKGWGEQCLHTITLASREYSVPGIIAETYRKILAFYRLSYQDACNELPTLYAQLRQLMSQMQGFRLRFYTPITIEACRIIEEYLPKQSVDDKKLIEHNP